MVLLNVSYAIRVIVYQNGQIVVSEGVLRTVLKYMIGEVKNIDVLDVLTDIHQQKIIHYVVLTLVLPSPTALSVQIALFAIFVFQVTIYLMEFVSKISVKYNIVFNVIKKGPV